MLADYRQVYDPLGNSLGLSSIVAALPLITLFVLLGVVRMRAWLASIIGLAVWPAALVCGAAFGVFQYLASNFWSIPLADIIASLASALAVLAFTRVWHPKEGYVETAGEAPAHRGPARHRRHVSGDPGEGYPAAAASAPAASDSPVRDTPGDAFKAYAPYLIIIVIFVVATRVPAITGVAPPNPARAAPASP